MCLAVFQMYKPNEPVTIWKFKYVVQLYLIVIMLYIIYVWLYIFFALNHFWILILLLRLKPVCEVSSKTDQFKYT